MRRSREVSVGVSVTNAYNINLALSDLKLPIILKVTCFLLASNDAETPDPTWTDNAHLRPVSK
jgi:hypothetical protein